MKTVHIPTWRLLWRLVRYQSWFCFSPDLSLDLSLCHTIGIRNNYPSSF